MHKERIGQIFEMALSLPFLAFSRGIRTDIRQNQNGICAGCQATPIKLEVHHIVPQHLGGSDDEKNAIGLCPNCHQYWDHVANDGIIYPGIPIEQAKPEQVKPRLRGRTQKSDSPRESSGEAGWMGLGI